MNRVSSIIILIIMFFIFFGTANSQDIQVITHRTYIDSTLGSEMVFDFEVVNISQYQQTVFEVRTINNLVPGWYSSLCFGESCFPTGLDSVATTQDFYTDPLNPSDTLKSSLHVTALQNDGTSYVQIQIGTIRNPTVRTTIDFTATTNPVSVNDEYSIVNNYYLRQNYPNPFNPSTKIDFGLKKAGHVEITIYNVLGTKVATVFNGFKPAGNHSVTFTATELSSGVYFYKIVTEGFVQTKKMILEK